MNVVIFTDTYYPEANGIAVSSKTLVDVLKEHGHQVLVVTSTYDNKKPTNENNVYYISLKKNKKRSLISTISVFNNSIFKHIKAFKPDIIHNQTNGQIGQLGKYCARKLKVPFVYTYHQHYEEYAAYVESGILNRMARARERRFLREMADEATEFIVPSYKIKKYLRKKGFDKYINVIPTALDLKQFEIDDSVKKDNKYLHKKYDISDKDRVLLFVGTLSEEKNIDLLFNCFKKYLDTNPKEKCVLMVVGEGNQLESLKNLTAQLNMVENVIFVGKVNHEKIKSFYDLADVFTTASTSETQSIAATEAMATHCVVLLKDDETLDQLIERDKNGFTFNDDDSFAEELNRIFKLSKDDLEKVKKNAYKTIVSDYSLDSYYQKVEEVYARALRKKW